MNQADNTEDFANLMEELKCQFFESSFWDSFFYWFK